MAGMQSSGGSPIADRPREGVTSPVPDVEAHHATITSAAGLGTTLSSAAAGELVDVAIRIPCDAPAPCVLNGGGYAGCRLAKDHAEEDHEFVLKWH